MNRTARAAMAQQTVADDRRDAVVAGLADGTPSIVVESVGENAIHLNPMTLEAGEEQIILSRLLELASARVAH